DSRITLQTVAGGLCLYLLLGLAFAFTFNLTEDVSGDPFFANSMSGTPNDFLYFSLATLTTTGYGDFSAATEAGRALAVTEALAGQIYLVTVVALIVGNLGRQQRDGPGPLERRLIGEEGADGEGGAGPGV
ncbi:MAG TPA: potassium channel family protein, partial [Solirubrobacterales bacterium]|nr:potassium channel family protein [Solirubrobacterales bacterium]